MGSICFCSIGACKREVRGRLLLDYVSLCYLDVVFVHVFWLVSASLFALGIREVLWLVKKMGDLLMLCLQLFGSGCCS